MKKVILGFILLFIFLFCVACQTTDSNQKMPLTVDDNSSSPANKVLQPSQNSNATPAYLENTANDVTNQPVVAFCNNTQPDVISLGGSCENDCQITIVSDIETITIKSFKDFFQAQIKIPHLEQTIITITASADQKKPSEPIEITAEYNPECLTQENGWNVFISDSSHAFAELSFPDFEGKNLLSQSQIDSFVKRINDKTQALEQNVPECQLIYMIVPNPLTVYGDNPPANLKKSPITRLDQVIQAINQTDAVALDLREIMYQHRYDQFQPYLHTDSHWSEYGAYLGLSVLCDYICQDFPQAKIRPVQEYGFQNLPVTAGDMIYYLGADPECVKQQAPFYNPSFDLPITAKKYLDGSLRMDFDATSSRITICNQNPDLPDCVVFRDSYGVALYEILPERFNNTSYYHTWGYNFDLNYIKKASPDYVIYIIAERNLESIIK